MIPNQIRPAAIAAILICALTTAFAQTMDQQAGGKTLAITVNRHLPPYQLRLVPFDVPPGNEAAVRVGQIVVTRQGDAEPIQTLDVLSACDPGFVREFFRVEDINFDGYLDIAAPIAHGAKWASFNYWTFDPATGKFVTTALTKQLRGLGWNEMTLSPRAHTIQVEHLNLGRGALVGEIYKVENNGLRLIAVERNVTARDGSYVPKWFKPTAKDRRDLPPKEN